MTSQQRYFPYGEIRDGHGSSPTDFGFTSQRNEASFGLMDYNARYYSPLLGRFVSPDSIVPEPSLSGGFNRYMYVSGNPVMYTDPTGHVLNENITKCRFFCGETDVSDWPDEAIMVALSVCTIYSFESCGYDTSRGVLIGAMTQEEYLQSMADSGLGISPAPLGIVSTGTRRIALGLGDELLDFAYSHAAIPWRMWKGTVTRRSTTTSGRNFGRALTDALRNADEIRFNLTGIDDLAEAFQLGKAGFRYIRHPDNPGVFIPQNATNTELTTILRTPEFLKKTKFYRDGEFIKTEKVLEEVGLLLEEVGF